MVQSLAMTTATTFGGITRRRQGRLVAGVCAGAAHRWRLDVSVLRFAILLTAFAGGAGVILYGVAWSVLPLDEGDDVDTAPPIDRVERVAVILVALGATLVLRATGLWFSDSVGLVGALAAVGVTLVWGGARGTEELGEARALRVAVGLALIGLGLTTLVVLSGDLASISRTLVSAVLAGLGVALLLGPNIARLAAELGDERRARIRVEERAEIAAHLHDGVLQTLALIQRRADDAKEVVALARRQERELRDWLHGEAPGEATLAGLLRTEFAAVEDDLGVRVELVCVGDAGADAAVRALVAAAREATANAARHAGVGQVDVYVEVDDESIEAFVRDRGVGFDPAAIGADRRGVTESIIGRMRRVGGEATIRSRPGEGAEVRLRLPRRSG